jgi:transcriptional regulator with XRE-family HTH domain
MADERLGVAHRLRQARLSLGLTLHDVAARSSGEFTASALGTYERGERSPSVLRVMRLAEIYGIGLDSLIGDAPDVDLIALEARGASATRELHDDVAVLAALARFSSYVRSIRRTPPTEPLRVRDTDCQLLGVLFGADRVSVNRWLAQFGLDGSTPVARSVDAAQRAGVSTAVTS